MPVASVLPDSDVLTGWDVTFPASPTTHYTKIDELVSAPDDTDYNETTTIGDVDEQTFQDSPANTDQVTSIDLHIRAKIDDSAATAKIRLELFHSGSTPVTGNPKDVVGGDLGGYGVLGNATKTWGSLTLTRAQADSLTCKETFLAV